MITVELSCRVKRSALADCYIFTFVNALMVWPGRLFPQGMLVIHLTFCESGDVIDVMIFRLCISGNELSRMRFSGIGY